MFKSHDNCIAKWCFKTRAPEEGYTYNETDNEFCCKQNNNQLYNILKKTIFPFQIEKVLKESLHMFDTRKKRINEQCDSIRCAKKKTMANIMSRKNRISCLVGIYIFGFKTYWKQVFNLMEIQTTPTFKQFLQAETVNADKN